MASYLTYPWVRLVFAVWPYLDVDGVLIVTELKNMIPSLAGS